MKTLISFGGRSVICKSTGTYETFQIEPHRPILHQCQFQPLVTLGNSWLEMAPSVSQKPLHFLDKHSFSHLVMRRNDLRLVLVVVASAPGGVVLAGRTFKVQPRVGFGLWLLLLLGRGSSGLGFGFSFGSLVGSSPGPLASLSLLGSGGSVGVGRRGWRWQWYLKKHFGEMGQLWP